MDFDKDNFEEDNELAPLEEEEAGDVEVAGVEIDEIVAEDDVGRCARRRIEVDRHAVVRRVGDERALIVREREPRDGVVQGARA